MQTFVYYICSPNHIVTIRLSEKRAHQIEIILTLLNNLQL
jgi:hypothetical protein